MNLAIIIGHLGRDPETGATQSGKRWAKLNVATSQSWKDKATGERKEKTEWHYVAVWGDGLVKFIAENAKKGSKVAVQGKLETSKYTDRSGVERWKTEIVINGFGATFRLLDGKGGGDRAPAEPEREWEGDSEIPF